MSSVPTPLEVRTGLSDSAAFNAGVRDCLKFLLNPPIAELIQIVGQSIPNVTWTALSFTSHVVDKDYLGGTMHSDSTNPSRATANFAGFYRCNGGYSTALSATGNRGTRWAVNGTAVNASDAWVPGTAGANNALAARTKMIYLNVGDYVELQVYQSSGGALLTSAAAEGASSMSIGFVSN